MLNEILNTFYAEFSDLNFVEFTRVLIRLSVAAVLGGLLGFEREQHGKSAGMRTHMIVAIGAAMFVMIPKFSGIQDSDMSRVLQGIIAGIGFLGAGTIVKNDGEDIQGLTTAAGIWLTAAIGIAAGMGRDATAVLCTIFAVVVLSIIPRFQPKPKPKTGGPEKDGDPEKAGV